MDEVTGDRSCLPTYDRNGLITSWNRKSFVVARIHGNIFLIFYRELRYSYKYVKMRWYFWYPTSL